MSERPDTLDSKILSFLFGLKAPSGLPNGVGVLNPWLDQEVQSACDLFYPKYFHDKANRTIILGINPGRFGGGMTGIAFTDPVRLETECGIQTPFPKRSELSSTFIYEVIRQFGGTMTFYKEFFLSSVVPVGFTMEGKNLNYYDLPKLEAAITPLVPAWMKLQLEIGMKSNRCICLGEGKNLDFLQRMNERHKWFERIDGLAHPRFLMQYKRKDLQANIDRYLKVLSDD